MTRKSEFNDTTIPVARYPLRWPAGRDRLSPGVRRRARFRSPFEDAYDALVDELRRIGAFNAKISSNVPLSDAGDGVYLPIVKATKKVEDPAVAAHFDRSVGTQGSVRSYAIACDSYDTVAANLKAVAVTLKAMREIARHGACEMVEQALDGFRALPAATPELPETPEVPEVIDVEVVEVKTRAA